MDTNNFQNNLPEIIKQLESCGYSCEAGSLENNLAFIELKRMAGNLEEATVLAKSVWAKEPIDTIEKGFIQTVALKFLELSNFNVSNSADNLSKAGILDAVRKEIENLSLIALSLTGGGHHMHADKLLEITGRLKRIMPQHNEQVYGDYCQCSPPLEYSRGNFPCGFCGKPLRP